MSYSEDGIYYESEQMEDETRAVFVDRRLVELRGIVTEQLHALWDRQAEADETDSAASSVR